MSRLIGERRRSSFGIGGVFDSNRFRLVGLVEKDSQRLLLGEKMEIRLRFGTGEEGLDEAVRGVGSSTGDWVDPLRPLSLCESKRGAEREERVFVSFDISEDTIGCDEGDERA